MPQGTIVQEAAQAALASDHPLRVVDEQDNLIGIVDDAAILRVVVAEDSGYTARRTPARHRRRAPGPGTTS